ncbi:MAG: UbiD family decarboxylase [Deltaproteobacteria bacterium]|nr:UbiD family decarboxylase [Deltaproteobacteria bacterium]
MTYYNNLHEWLQFLEARGRLIRVSRPINKDTELHPLVRLQFRGLKEKDRKGWLFEKVTDVAGRTYDMPVALAVMAPSRSFYALGMGVSSPREIVAKWAEAQTHPIPPRIISSAPCQELSCEHGSLVDGGGLGMLPVPISTPGFDCAPFLTSGHWVTKDPETGAFNFGTYRGQIKSPTRLGLFAFAYQDISRHWTKARALGKPLEAAVVIGSTPNLSYCSTARLPIPEYPVAGGIAGAPLDLVRCKTVDLLVPAQSEIVIEGIIPTDELEPEGPFGEFTGYMAHREPDKFMNVTCITRKRDAVFQAFFSQFPPSESSVLRGVGMEGVIFKLLTVDYKMDGILDVSLHEAAGSHGLCVVQMSRAGGAKPLEALRLIAEMPRAVPKILIAVDEDIDPRDADAVNWAMSYRMQPHRDMEIREISSSTALDFSLAPPSSRADAEKIKATAVLIDASRKWDYPPTSLPKKEYMERAQSIWQELGLPDLELRHPWFGYNLGSWSRDDEEDAERAVKGEHYVTGKEREGQRKRL